MAWELKKKIGPLAYVLAGLKALCGASAQITVIADTITATGSLVLIGNGKLYGGSFRVFPQASLRDGLLDVCVFPKANWLTLARCGPELLLRGQLPGSQVQLFQARSVRLTSNMRTPSEIDGELFGNLPATFSLASSQLRVVVP